MKLKLKLIFLFFTQSNILQIIFVWKFSYNVIHKFYLEATIINEISQTILFYLAFWDFIRSPYKENLVRVVVCQGIIDCPFDSALKKLRDQTSIILVTPGYPRD